VGWLLYIIEETRMTKEINITEKTKKEIEQIFDQKEEGVHIVYLSPDDRI
jgi:hypothetical protein